MLGNRSSVWVAVETSAYPVELELVPAVEIPTTWSEKARWPRCLQRWPSQERVECIKVSVDGTPTCQSSDASSLTRHSITDCRQVSEGKLSYHWQLSFFRAEQVLLEQLDDDGGCRRKCFQVMRQLKEDVWCPGNRPVITSHHLQVNVGQVGEGPGAALENDRIESVNISFTCTGAFRWCSNILNVSLSALPKNTRAVLLDGGHVLAEDTLIHSCAGSLPNLHFGLQNSVRKLWHSDSPHLKSDALLRDPHLLPKKALLQDCFM
ncbi:hypothetical protein P7K49_016279 [Saguinus oedipus]|uniref:Mab-21-like nucleotidyltransferase domain-containing protein n=1 Tax=Saguinus oedipus TaxID=9490 RepID=A0ABQ9VC70_SAGOE|nr:hypothetical protein P7K49_016279 [Saguinus oedipus]